MPGNYVSSAGCSCVLEWEEVSHGSQQFTQFWNFLLLSALKSSTSELHLLAQNIGPVTLETFPQSSSSSCSFQQCQYVWATVRLSSSVFYPPHSLVVGCRFLLFIPSQPCGGSSQHSWFFWPCLSLIQGLCICFLEVELFQSPAIQWLPKEKRHEKFSRFLLTCFNDASDSCALPKVRAHGHAACFQFGAILNNVTVNLLVHIFW